MPKIGFVSLCLLAASCGQGTYVVVNVQRGATTPATAITKLELQLQLGTQMTSKSYAETNNGAITLPADLVLEIGSASGQLTATATARDMSGNPVDQGVGTTTVARNKTANLSITLGMTPGGTLPAAVTGVTVCRNNAQNSVFWPLVMGATGYNVYAGTASGVTKGGTPVGAMVTSPPFRHTGLTNGTTYFYVVTAVNAAGESALVSNEVSAIPEMYTAPSNILYSSNNDLPLGAVYGWTNFTGNPSMMPNMTLSGAGTMMSRPWSASVFVDTVGGLLYVTSGSQDGTTPPRRITVYKNASSINGAVAPSRTLQDGPLQNLRGITVDTTRNIMYFINRTPGASQIVVYANACNVAGSPAPPPRATIAGTATTFDILNQPYINEKTDELYVTNAIQTAVSDTVLVFNNASTLTGTLNMAPTRTITVRDGTNAILAETYGVAVDPDRNILYLTHRGAEPSAATPTHPNSTIYVVDNASSLTGLVPINRKITGLPFTVLSHPMVLHLVNNRLFVSCDADGPKIINSWINANTLNGSPAPVQTPMPAFTSNFTSVFYVP